MVLPWESELPAHISPNVCQRCLEFALDIAANGLDERRPHHGFTLIIGDRAGLLECGSSGFNIFIGHDVSLGCADGTVNSWTTDVLRRNALHTDGAVVIDGLSGQIIASNFFVSDISSGSGGGGGRSRSARAVARQAGGCYVMKCSEDSKGALVLHLDDLECRVGD